MEVFSKILGYLNPLNWFRKETSDMNLRFMHGINKISLLIFLATLIYLLTIWF
jgi:hypothetical protein